MCVSAGTERRLRCAVVLTMAFALVLVCRQLWRWRKITDHSKRGLVSAQLRAVRYGLGAPESGGELKTSSL